MRKIYPGAVLFIGTGCYDRGGNTSIYDVAFFIVMLVIFSFIAADQRRQYLSGKEDYEDKRNKEFANEFTFQLKQKNIAALNCIIRPPEYGLAIFDNQEQIAVFTAARVMHFIPKEKIISCELTINYKTHESVESETPSVAVDIPHTLEEPLTSEFQEAILSITLDDVQTSLFTLPFSDLKLAEKYKALIKNLISKKENI